jgi:hypothetical protein
VPRAEGGVLGVFGTHVILCPLMRWAGQVVSRCLMDDIFNLLEKLRGSIYVVLGLAALFSAAPAYQVWQSTARPSLA